MTAEKLQGTLDLLVLKVLARDPLHCSGVATREKRVSGMVLVAEEGSLYPALHRKERDDWIAAEWRASENNRRPKFYRLTPAGRKRLAAEERRWERVTGAVAKVLRFA